MSPHRKKRKDSATAEEIASRMKLYTKLKPRDTGTSCGTPNGPASRLLDDIYEERVRSETLSFKVNMKRALVMSGTLDRLEKPLDLGVRGVCTTTAIATLHDGRLLLCAPCESSDAATNHRHGDHSCIDVGVLTHEDAVCVSRAITPEVKQKAEALVWRMDEMKHETDSIRLAPPSRLYLGGITDGVYSGSGWLMTTTRANDDGSPLVSCEYSGGFVSGMRHGNGTQTYRLDDAFSWQSGHATYEGQWRDDMRHGDGILHCRGRLLVAGEWRNDVIHYGTIMEMRASEFCHDRSDAGVLNIDDQPIIRALLRKRLAHGSHYWTTKRVYADGLASTEYNHDPSTRKQQRPTGSVDTRRPAARTSAKAPKPTLYNGFQFRSQLEARWALLLDLLGYTYFYEPYTVRRPGDRCYTTDFLVVARSNEDGRLGFPTDADARGDAQTSGSRQPNVFWLEIKPTVPTNEERQKMSDLVSRTRITGYIFWGQDFVDPFVDASKHKEGLRGIWFSREHPDKPLEPFRFTECNRCSGVEIAYYGTGASEWCDCSSRHIRRSPKLATGLVTAYRLAGAARTTSKVV